MVNIRKETFDRLHKFCFRGEKHDKLVNRLIEVCKMKEEQINLSKDTVNELLRFSGGSDIDEALNIVMDKCRELVRK